MSERISLAATPPSPKLLARISASRRFLCLTSSGLSSSEGWSLFSTRLVRSVLAWYSCWPLRFNQLGSDLNSIINKSYSLIGGGLTWGICWCPRPSARPHCICVCLLSVAELCLCKRHSRCLCILSMRCRRRRRLFRCTWVGTSVRYATPLCNAPPTHSSEISHNNY